MLAATSHVGFDQAPTTSQPQSPGAACDERAGSRPAGQAHHAEGAASGHGGPTPRVGGDFHDTPSLLEISPKTIPHPPAPTKLPFAGRWSKPRGSSSCLVRRCVFLAGCGGSTPLCHDLCLLSWCIEMAPHNPLDTLGPTNCWPCIAQVGIAASIQHGHGFLIAKVMPRPGLLPVLWCISGQDMSRILPAVSWLHAEKQSQLLKAGPGCPPTCPLPPVLPTAPGCGRRGLLVCPCVREDSLGRGGYHPRSERDQE